MDGVRSRPNPLKADRTCSADIPHKLAPKWYSQYRFYLSILVGTCIIGTLAGISYYGPVAGHGLLSHDLQMIQNERRRRRPEVSGTIDGDIEAVSTGEGGDAYVQVRKKQKSEEEHED